MLQTVNDYYWSPKPRRNDVPVTSALQHVALPELKHCEVPDSVLSIVSTLHYAPLRHAALYRAIHATLRFPTLFRAIRASLRYTTLYRTICASLSFSALLYATLRSYQSLRYNALLNEMPRYATLPCTTPRCATLPCATLRYAPLPCATQQYAALLWQF